jgi:hypothetical protein
MAGRAFLVRGVVAVLAVRNAILAPLAGPVFAPRLGPVEEVIRQIR